MQFPDSLLSGKINLFIAGRGCYSRGGAYFMPVESRSERCVRNFFDSHKLMTVGEFCECLQKNMDFDHAAIDFRTETHRWCVFVKTTQFDGTNSYDTFKVLRKESLLLEIHPYILNNYKLFVSMTPEWERDGRVRLLPGDATPEFLLQSAKISSDWEMNQSYSNVTKELYWWKKNEAGVKGQGDALLQRAIVDFEQYKLMAIRVHNDIQYTASVLSLDPLK